LPYNNGLLKGHNNATMLQRTMCDLSHRKNDV